MNDHFDTASALRTSPKGVAIGIKAKRQDSMHCALLSGEFSSRIVYTDCASRI